MEKVESQDTIGDLDDIAKPPPKKLKSMFANLPQRFAKKVNKDEVESLRDHEI
jgi:hypothetical protein